MGRIVAFVMACLAAVGGWYLGDMLHSNTVWLIGNVQNSMLSVEFRHLYAALAGVTTWLLALHLLWPRPQ